MKLVTMNDGSPDGRLHVVSSDGTRVLPMNTVRTLQEALERWSTYQGELAARAAALDEEQSLGNVYDPAEALAPLPRAWQWLDGSAFETHMQLMQQAWNLPVTGLPERPLMYQGLSDHFLPPSSDAVFPSVKDDIDFEGEFGVILDRVPMGTAASEAGHYIRLVVLINDWSLRALGPVEMATGFGWLQCKPRCSIAPLAVTPDELGAKWSQNKVCLPLEIKLNGTVFGQANGQEMKFGFDELIAHAAYSRDLPAGTILGSGTVANTGYAEVGSSCIAERRAIEHIATGTAKTPFLQIDDVVEMTCEHPERGDLFGQIHQRVRVK